MNKADRLKHMRENFPKYRKDDNIDIGGVITSSSDDIADTMEGMNTFQEDRRDKKNIRGVINSDD